VIALTGMMIPDQIRGRANPWATLYDPTRRARKDFSGIVPLDVEIGGAALLALSR
jgi:hypothetical protein